MQLRWVLHSQRPHSRSLCAPPMEATSVTVLGHALRHGALLKLLRLGPEPEIAFNLAELEKLQNLMTGLKGPQ